MKNRVYVQHQEIILHDNVRNLLRFVSRAETGKFEDNTRFSYKNFNAIGVTCLLQNDLFMYCQPVSDYNIMTFLKVILVNLIIRVS